jgi:hypothetical protein
VPSIVGIDGPIVSFRNPRRPIAPDREIDSALADSFPASDPPSWNPGAAVLGHVAGISGTPVAVLEPPAAGAYDPDRNIIDVSRPASAERTFLQGLVSLAGAAGIALLAPFAILLLGLPVALALRGLLEVIGWLFGVHLQ